MPKKPDAQLGDRIINAAYHLWAKGGEHALTMRAVAKAANTTTPTLYERFADRRALLAALAGRAQRNLLNVIEPSKSIVEACRAALEYTVANRHEYELVAKDWAGRLSRNEPTPSLNLIKERLASQLGGSPSDQAQLALSLATLYHGASMLLLNEGISPETAAAIEDACIAATDVLVQPRNNPSSAPSGRSLA